MGTHTPSLAERARTAVRLSPTVRVRTAGAQGDIELHGNDSTGAVVLVVPDGHPLVRAVRAAADDLPVLLDATDLCPIPVADRVRTRVRLAGRMHEPPEHRRRELAVVAADREAAGALLDIGHGCTVLYVDVGEVLVATGEVDLDGDPNVELVSGAIDLVGAADYAQAVADPVADAEAVLLGHLLADHADELALLAELVPPAVRAAAGRVLPVRLDRYGLLLRAVGPAGATDVRLSFREPLTCLHELPARMGELIVRAATARGHPPTAGALPTGPASPS